MVGGGQVAWCRPGVVRQFGSLVVWPSERVAQPFEGTERLREQKRVPVALHPGFKAIIATSGLTVVPDQS